MLSFANLAPEKQEFVLGAMRKLSDAMVIEDTADLLAFMDSDKTIRQGRLAPLVTAWAGGMSRVLPENSGAIQGQCLPARR